MVSRVYEALGCNLASIADTVLSRQESDLHAMVACFLRARFPIVVALNKIDIPEAKARAEKVRAALGDSACVSVSAATEWWLVEQARKGSLSYIDGSGAESVEFASGAPEDVR